MIIQSYEKSLRRFTFETHMKIANKYEYTITIQKNKNSAYRTHYF